MLRTALLAVLAASVSAWSPTACKPALAPIARASHVSMVDAFRWSNAKAGSKVETKDFSGIEWARAAWATTSDKMVDGECYLVSDLAPDASKEWYFCSTPSDSPDMDCEQLPEWMGKMSDGSAVYICSTAKVA